MLPGTVILHMTRGHLLLHQIFGQLFSDKDHYTVTEQIF